MRAVYVVYDPNTMCIYDVTVHLIYGEWLNKVVITPLAGCGCGGSYEVNCIEGAECMVCRVEGAMTRCTMGDDTVNEAMDNIVSFLQRVIPLGGGIVSE